MRRPQLTTALGVLVFVDVLRVWLPSIIAVFGQAGSTPAELLGAFALLWFVLGLAAPAVARAAGPSRAGAAAAVVLAACRLALIFTAGQTQLYVASAGLLAGLCWLVTLAMRAAPPAGLVAGLVLATLQHAALGTLDPTWRGWPGVLLVAVTTIGFALSAAPGEPESTDVVPAGSVAAWFLVGPVLLLALQIGLSPALVGTGVSYLTGTLAGDRVAESPGTWGNALHVLLTVLAMLMFARLAVRPPRQPWSRALCAAGLVLGAVVFALAAYGSAGGGLLLVAVPVVAATLGGCFGMAWHNSQAASAGTGGVRAGYAVAAGMLVFALATFAYYAAYDLGYPNGWVPPLIAAIVAGVALRHTQPAPAAPALASTRLIAVGAGLAVLLVAAGAWWFPPAARNPSGPAELRVVAYNVRMGFGLDGRFSIDDLARIIRGQRPDVVMLSEVDRGWLLNGGHDDLTLLARAVGMRYLFAPAADPVWGDAILTNLPVLSTRTRRLPDHGAPTGAQVLGAVLRHRAGGEVAVVSTHLQPPPGRGAVEQARIVARFGAALRTPSRPVIVAGDFNTQPGQDAFRELLAAGFTDALAASRPLPTSPADAPRSEIDHIFVLGGAARDVVAPPGTASDHLAVAATITW